MKRVNIIIGRFQPFTYGHLKCIQNVYNKHGLPTIIIMINTPESKVDLRHPFSSNLLNPIYNELFKMDPTIEKVILYKNANIVEIGKMLYEEGYEIASWVCGEDRFEAYSAMANKYKEDARLPLDFKMNMITRTNEDISATQARNLLINNDIKGFSIISPLTTYFKILRKEIMKLYENI